MKNSRLPAWKNRHGAAMLTVLVFLALMSALTTALSMNTQTTLKLTGATGRDRKAFYTAEAGLNVGITRFVNRFKTRGVPTQDEFEQEVELGARTAKVTLAAVDGCDPCEPSIIPVGEVFGGLNSIPYRYTVHSESINDQGDRETLVGGEFDIHNIPIFQFLAFIDNHLFIMPLPDVSLHGRIHTNSNLYLQPDNTLRIQDRPTLGITSVQVTAAGDIYRGGRKYDSSWRCWGKLFIDKLKDVDPPLDDLDPKEMDCEGQAPLPDDTLDEWLGSLKSEVENIITPDVGIIARGTGEYWQAAELRIVLNLSAGRETINFGASTICSGASNLGVPSGGLFPIEVQNANGTRNLSKTNELWRFMCERRGSIFYNDLPTTFGERQPPNDATNSFADARDYNPRFGGPSLGGPNWSTQDSRPPPIDDNDARVFRRVGYDSNGDGTIDNKDRNLDICPIGSGTSPGWRPSYCPWPNTGPVLTSWYLDMDYRRGGFWNHRETQWMYLLNVNMRNLIEWNRLNGDPLFDHADTTDGGLVIFLSVQGPDSTTENAGGVAGNNYGVRVFDSADLDMLDSTFSTPPPEDPTGLTVVSDQAVIVQGNYNSVDKYPAAIMGDTIYTLSQGWEVPTNCWLSEGSGSNFNPCMNDRKMAADLSSGRRDVPKRDCSSDGLGTAIVNGSNFNGPDDLVINAAWLFGLGPSTRDPDWYNGGIENFPKYLESWSSRTLNYRGSFVSLGLPQYKLGNWSGGSGTTYNFYDPPSRDFDYDPAFNDVKWLPPLTPKIVYPQQRLYTRIFR